MKSGFLTFGPSSIPTRLPPRRYCRLVPEPIGGQDICRESHTQRKRKSCSSCAAAMGRHHSELVRSRHHVLLLLCYRRRCQDLGEFEDSRSRIYLTCTYSDLKWKKYLTTLQITQFVIDLFVTYFACMSRLASRREVFSSLLLQRTPTSPWFDSPSCPTWETVRDLRPLLCSVPDC